MNQYFCLIVLLALVVAAVAQAETVYFLVAEIYPYHNDSYVLPLHLPSDIEHARDLIEYGPFAPETGVYIAVASIDRWDPYIGINTNRDYLQSGIPVWSWYVTNFDGFAEMTMEVCDGCPTGVEEDLEAWVGEGGVGQVCFWDYTVVVELGTDLEPWNCDMTVDGVVDFHDLAWFTLRWLDSGCCHRYYCEGTDINGSDIVDMNDFAIFAENWLWRN